VIPAGRGLSRGSLDGSVILASRGLSRGGLDGSVVLAVVLDFVRGVLLGVVLLVQIKFKSLFIFI
jgi:hypothetical protein